MSLSHPPGADWKLQQTPFNYSIQESYDGKYKIRDVIVVISYLTETSHREISDWSKVCQPGPRWAEVWIKVAHVLDCTTYCLSDFYPHYCLHFLTHILVNLANQGRRTPLPKPRDVKPNGLFLVFSSPWHLGSQLLSLATFFSYLAEHSTCLCLLLLHLDIKLYLKRDKPKTISTFLSSCIPTCISPEISHSRKWNPCSSQNSGQNHSSCPCLLLFFWNHKSNSSANPVGSTFMILLCTYTKWVWNSGPLHF